MTACWSVAWKARRRPQAASSFPTPPRRSPQEGEVVAVGNGHVNEAGDVTPLDVKAGDRILFGKWSGTEVKLDGEELIIMKESDILGVIEKVGKVKKAA